MLNDCLSNMPKQILALGILHPNFYGVSHFHKSSGDSSLIDLLERSFLSQAAGAANAAIEQLAKRLLELLLKVSSPLWGCTACARACSDAGRARIVRDGLFLGRL